MIEVEVKLARNDDSVRLTSQPVDLYASMACQYDIWMRKNAMRRTFEGDGVWKWSCVSVLFC